jgi:hypothetical protein
MALAPASSLQNATPYSWRFRIETRNKQKSVVIKSNDLALTLTVWMRL